MIDWNAEKHNTAEYYLGVNIGVLGDVNCDGAINVLDINTFVDCILTGVCECP
ncbi:hypothetical protein RAS1_23970 [Phycisphaerae bacterium RAS1]|nr:hypothetical protein RAS1_23970 [Phycisphaerae bacterium RAS1]